MCAAKTIDPSAPLSETISSILQRDSLGILVTIVETPNDKVGSKLLLETSGGRLETAGGRIATLGADDGALDDAVAAEAARFLHTNKETHFIGVKEFAPQLSGWAEAKLLFERIQAEPRLVICGAGHVGASLARIASLLGYCTTLIDDRPEFVAREAFPDARIELVEAQDWSDAVRQAVGTGKGVSVAIVTRGHSEDEECLRVVINLNADYVGLIGSKRRTSIVLQRLREKGATEEELNVVRAPVGLDIGAVTPEEVALAIMAEIVAVRRGGGGASLSSWRRSRSMSDKL